MSECFFWYWLARVVRTKSTKVVIASPLFHVTDLRWTRFDVDCSDNQVCVIGILWHNITWHDCDSIWDWPYYRALNDAGCYCTKFQLFGPHILYSWISPGKMIQPSLSLCSSVCLSTHITPKSQAKLDGMAKISSDDIAICYVVPFCGWCRVFT